MDAHRIKLIILSIGILFLFSCKNSNDKSTRLPSCKVGINLTLTGNAANWGSEVKKGLVLGFRMFNDTCKRMQIETVVEDNQMDPGKAVSITKKLLDVDQCDLIISGYTPVVKATAPIVNERGIPYLATLTSAADVTDAMPWVFRDFVREPVYMPMLARYAANLGLKKGSALVVNDDFGLDARYHFGQRFVSLGGNMDPGEVFDASDTDLRNKISSVLSSDPDFILVVGRGAAMINGIRQIREKNPDLPLFLPVSIDDDMIWNALGEAANGIIFARIDINSQHPGFLKVDSVFNETYGYNIKWMNIYGYSIACYLCRGFYENGCDPDSMRSYLETLDYSCLRGLIHMDASREVIAPLKIVRRFQGETIQVN
ncbi:MAG: ABC transporter substrate-binding protein [Bacteroidetes bacterium]|nr:ABC transporter substrate-binding protein [Bacteroidota bacterium]